MSKSKLALLTITVQLNQVDMSHRTSLFAFICDTSDSNPSLTCAAKTPEFKEIRWFSHNLKTSILMSHHLTSLQFFEVTSCGTWRCRFCWWCPVCCIEGVSPVIGASMTDSSAQKLGRVKWFVQHFGHPLSLSSTHPLGD